jgi:uncharacterized membrane protein
MTASFTPAIWIHVSAAVSALVLGATIFIARKGTFLHRISGRVWAGLMLVAAVSTAWIKANGSYSWIHLLSIATLAILAAVVYRRDERAHSQAPRGSDRLVLGQPRRRRPVRIHAASAARQDALGRARAPVISLR